MKVGIDTFGLEHGESGLGAYLYYLMQNISQDDEIEYDLFGLEADRYTYKAKFDTGFSAVDIPDVLKKQQRWHKRKVNRFTKQKNYDVVLYCAATRMLPKKFAVNSIAIVNDIVSKLLENRKDIFLRKVCMHGLKKIGRIIVPSEFVKNDLVQLGIESQKITVIPNGIDHSIFYQHNLSEGDYVDIKPFAIKRPYIIYPTRISGPEKYHVQLIEAFNHFKAKTQAPHRLVLAGSHDEYSEEVQRAVLRSPFASDIFMTGFFPHKELGLLYSNADACVFPSSQEGVGIPVLETMACGIPVACADRGSIPEVSAKNAVFFNPDNVEQIASAMEKVILDQNLRQELISKGLERAATFTWKNTADKIVEVVKKEFGMGN